MFDMLWFKYLLQMPYVHAKSSSCYIYSRSQRRDPLQLRTLFCFAFIKCEIVTSNEK